MPDHLAAEIAAESLSVLLGCIALAFGREIVISATRREWRFFRTPVGIGIMAISTKNLGEWIAATRDWWLGVGVAGPCRSGGPSLIFPPAFALVIVGSLMLIKAITPASWGHRGWLAAVALVVAVVAATHVPM